MNYCFAPPQDSQNHFLTSPQSQRIPSPPSFVNQLATSPVLSSNNNFNLNSLDLFNDENNCQQGNYLNLASLTPDRIQISPFTQRLMKEQNAQNQRQFYKSRSRNGHVFEATQSKSQYPLVTMTTPNLQTIKKAKVNVIEEAVFSNPTLSDGNNGGMNNMNNALNALSSLNVNGNNNNGMNQNQNLVRAERDKADLYKTELCTNWMLTGSCTYGNKCHFAHGVDDLKSRMRNENYKTQPCCDPAREGCRRCMYGRRCNYCHPGEAIRRSHPTRYYDKDYYTSMMHDYGSDNVYPFGIYV